MFEQAFKNIDDMHLLSGGEIHAASLAPGQEFEEFLGAISGGTQ
jgi:hypothetical protein